VSGYQWFGVNPACLAVSGRVGAAEPHRYAARRNVKEKWRARLSARGARGLSQQRAHV